MKSRNVILSVLVICSFLFFTGASCSNNQTTTSSTSIKGVQTTTSKLASNEDVNQELLKFAITTGDENSKVTIIEASDIQCPACRSIHSEIAQTVEVYKDKVQFGYVPYPLSYHPLALPAAYAIEAANIQGKGWEMHDKLFESDNFDEEGIIAAANDLGLDIDKFNQDRESDAVIQKIDDAKALLDELGLAGTPTFYLNGAEYQSSPTFTNLSAQIDKMLSE